MGVKDAVAANSREENAYAKPCNADPRTCLNVDKRES